MNNETTTSQITIFISDQKRINQFKHYIEGNSSAAFNLEPRTLKLAVSNLKIQKLENT